MKEVTILGRGDDWRECPFDTTELWGAATCLLVPGLGEKPYTKVFTFDCIKEDQEINKAVSMAKDRQIPVVSTRAFKTEDYPLKQIIEEYHCSYFDSSVAYMMAYALLLGYEQISIYGIGGRTRWDYEHLKPYLLMWIGIATGRKVAVRLGKGSSKWLFNVNERFLPKATKEEKDAWHEKYQD